MEDVATTYGNCEKCGLAITDKDDLKKFRQKFYHKKCLPTHKETLRNDKFYN